jgi:hypothetical protein
MPVLIMDPWLQEDLIRKRQELGHDLYDEVWEGVYIMSPLADDEHQDLVSGTVYVLYEVVQRPGFGKVRPGVNLSEQEDNWKANYRVPDVAVFLKDTKARNCNTHWAGAADFLVEITSPYDRTHEKLPFYEKIGVREVLLIDRDPWRLELYRRNEEQQLTLVGTGTPDDSATLASEVVPLTFQLVAGEVRPRILIHLQTGDRQWTV